MDKNIEDVGATAFDLPNSQNPRPYAKAHYGTMPVPHPTNNASKVTHPSEVMRAVLEGK